MYDSSSEQRLLPPSPAPSGASAVPRKRRAGVCSRALLRVLLVGQLLSLLVTGSGVFSQLLAGRNTNIPTSQSAANYFLLSFFLLPQIRAWWARRREAQRTVGLAAWDGQRSEQARERGIPAPLPSSDSVSSGGVPSAPFGSSPAELAASALSVSSVAPLLRVAWWKYLLLALCDVEGNYLLVKSYQYTSITSVQLLDCFTIPVVMILSRLLLKTVYNRKHLVGALVCLVGLTMLIVSDMLTNRNADADANGSRDRLFGDVLVLLGCVCYGISNLSQEVLVKSFDRREFLGMLGACGTMVSAIQMAVVERQALADVQWSDPVVIAYLLGFNACLFCLYVLTPLLLQSSSALFLNLSLLTSDFWSILFAVLLFKAALHPLYFAAFAIIIAGLLLYNLAGVEWKADQAADAGAGAAGAVEDGSASATAPPQHRSWKHVIAQVCGQAGLGDEDEDTDPDSAHDETIAASASAAAPTVGERHVQHPSYASSDASTPLSPSAAIIHPHAHSNADSTRWHS